MSNIRAILETSNSDLNDENKNLKKEINNLKEKEPETKIIEKIVEVKVPERDEVPVEVQVEVPVVDKKKEEELQCRLQEANDKNLILILERDEIENELRNQIISI